MSISFAGPRRQERRVPLLLVRHHPAARGHGAGMGFLNILCQLHTAFQPNEGIMWSYLSHIVRLKSGMKQTKNV